MDTIYTSRVARLRLQAIRHLNAQNTAYLDLSLQPCIMHHGNMEIGSGSGM